MRGVKLLIRKLDLLVGELKRYGVSNGWSTGKYKRFGKVVWPAG